LSREISVRLAITTAWERSRSFETSTRSPSRCVPPPRRADTVTPAGGLWITPTTGSPASTRAMETPNSGIFCVNSLVPSMGSMIQQRLLSVRDGSATVSSESRASSGKASLSRRAMARSDSRSASVTGLSFDFSQVFVSPW
jgi:hypothetical protein